MMTALKFIGAIVFVVVVYIGVVMLICRARYDGCYLPGIRDVEE